MLKRLGTEDTVVASSSSGSSETDSDSDSARSDARCAKPVRKGWKTVLIGSRGISTVSRKFLKELSLLLPHSKKESKFEGSKRITGLVEICELSNCEYFGYVHETKNNVFFNAGATSGPTVKYELCCIGLSEEQCFDGNSSKATRVLHMFSPYFWNSKEGNIQRQLLSKVFGPPVNHKKVRPFFDRIFYFFYTAEGIVFRNYQVLDDFSVLEIGPRFMLVPLLIQEGPLMGKILWKKTKGMMDPSQAGKLRKLAFAEKVKHRIVKSELSRTKRETSQDPEPEFEDIVFSK